MSWTARQRAMLDRMGVRLWSPRPVVAERWVEPAQTEKTSATDRLAPGATGAAVVPVAIIAAVAPHPPEPNADLNGIGALSWVALQTAVADCSLCKLHAHRRQALFGVGHPLAQWLIVGDPPVAEDDQAGEPFAGAAGQLLDRMLAALQLTRAADGEAPPAQRVYVTQALRCLPAPGDHPGRAEWDACEKYLVRQAALLQPRVLLAMGRFAAQALLRSSEPLGRLRGRVHRWQGLPLVVTYHPAFLLRNPDFKAAAWEDLVRAARCFEQSA